jgi:hypothetical protein
MAETHDHVPSAGRLKPAEAHPDSFSQCVAGCDGAGVGPQLSPDDRFGARQPAAQIRGAIFRLYLAPAGQHLEKQARIVR